MREKTVKSGAIGGYRFELNRRYPDVVLAEAAPYVLYMDDKFYCTYEFRNAADEEINALR